MSSLLKLLLLCFILLFGSQAVSIASPAKEFPSEETVGQAIECFCAHLIKGEFLKGLLCVNSTEGANKFYEDIKLLEKIVHQSASSGTVSTEVVTFGDLVRTYGILFVYDNGTVAFFDVHFLKIGGNWRLSNLSVKADSNSSEVFKSIPQYYLKNVVEKDNQEVLAKALVVESFNKLGIKELALNSFYDIVSVATSKADFREHRFKITPLDEGSILDNLEAVFNNIVEDEVFVDGTDPELLSFEQQDGDSIKLYLQILKDGSPYVIQTNVVIVNGEYRMGHIQLHRSKEEIEALMGRIKVLPYKVGFTPKRFKPGDD